MFIDFSDDIKYLDSQVNASIYAGVIGYITYNHRWNTKMSFHRKNCGDFIKLLHNDICMNAQSIILEVNERHLIKIAITLDNGAVMHVKLTRKLNKNGRYGSSWAYIFIERAYVADTQTEAIAYLRNWLAMNKV